MDPADGVALKALIDRQPVAALATVHQGEPAVSMTPVAVLPGGAGFVIHVSRLAVHTRDLIAHPEVALLITGLPGDAPTPLALPRVSIQRHAKSCERESPEDPQARAAYLARLPAAEELFAFADFSLFIIEPRQARYVAGFGRAMSLTADRLKSILAGA